MSNDMQTKINIIKSIAFNERQRILKCYCSTFGKCIEASDNITVKLLNNNINAHPKQSFILYENFESCMNYCYEEHWLTYALINGRRLYIDVTMDQFQWAFSKKLPEIFIDWKKPNFYLDKEPGKETLRKCGWIDWYKTGQYINSFDYYGG